MRWIITSLFSRINLYKLYTHRIYIYGFILMIGVGVYVGFLLFGDNSLEMLLKDIDEKEALLRSVGELQSQNALLQRELFELKGLEP